jgi:hypothetical protein
MDGLWRKEATQERRKYDGICAKLGARLPVSSAQPHKLGRRAKEGCLRKLCFGRGQGSGGIHVTSIRED